MAKYLIFILFFVSLDQFDSFCITPNLKLKLAIFRESVRTKNVTLNDIDVFEREFAPGDSKNCQKNPNSFVCPSETVIQIFKNQYPFFQVEKKCTCDRCQLPFTSSKNILNVNTKCMPILEDVPVLIRSHCEWTGILRPRVVGCQCSLSRTISIF